MVYFLHKKLILIIAVVFALGAGTTASAQFNIIWGHGGTVGVADGEFDGGLNNWTTMGSHTDAVFLWEADGVADMGAYSANVQPIASESVANGAAVFDSDFLDNAGIPGNFGNGLAPSPHETNLVSPVIDCSSVSEVSIRFNQAFRNFTSRTVIFASPDGGATWPDTIEVSNNFPDEPVETNTAVSPDDVRMYRLPSCGGSDNVVVRFYYGVESGATFNYYYWVIDDVQIVETPQYHNKLVKGFVAYTPNVYTPLSQTEPWIYAIDVVNEGAEAATNLGVNLIITNESGTELYNQRDEVAQSNPGDYHEFFFHEPFAAPDTGAYTGTYILSHDGTDQVTSDDSVSFDFVVTTSTFGKSLGISQQSIGVSNLEKFGNHYWAAAEDTAAYISFVAGNIDALIGAGITSATVYLYKWEDLDGSGTFTNDDGVNDNITEVAFGVHSFSTNDANWTWIDVELYDSDTGLKALLEPNTNYLAVVEQNGAAANMNVGMNRFRGFNYNGTWVHSRTDPEHTHPNLPTVLYSSSDSRWYSIGYGTHTIANVRLILGPKGAVKTNEIDASKLDIKITPNPAQDKIRLVVENNSGETDFEVKIYDLQGKLVHNETITNSLVSFGKIIDIDHLASGEYMISIQSQKYLQSERIIVTK